MENYMKYLNTKQIEHIKDYKLIDSNNFNILKPGDFLKYIIKKNLQFRQGGVIIKIIENTIIIRNLRCNYVYAVNTDQHILFHKEHLGKSNHREFMEYLLKGIDNNTIKVTKKTI